MQLETEKAKPRVATPPGTSQPDAHTPRNFTARMHFYAVHNAGEQLRRSDCAKTRTGRKPDRMMGR
jgi:hypothetical protein